MATPALRALRRHFGPQARITAIGRRPVAEVLAGSSWIDDWIWYDPRAGNRYQQAWAVIRQLRAARPDHCLLLTNSFWIAAIGRLGGCRSRTGYVRNGRGWLLSNRLHYPQIDGKRQVISEVDYFLSVAYAAGCPQEPRRLELATRPEDEAGADRVWQNLSLGKFRSLVAFNTGSAKSPSRHWPTESYLELARQLTERHPDLGVLVLCGPAERQTALEIVAAARSPQVLSMADQDLGLGVMKATIRRCQAVVTTDSGPRHLSHAFDVPTIVLAGPIDPRQTETYHARSVVLRNVVPCSPCGKDECRVPGHPCLTGLTVPRVLEATERFLAVRERLAG